MMPPKRTDAKNPRTNNDTAPKKTKSRNGCQRCKLKRLKCDEVKPECRNCVNRKVPCPGYKKNLKWSTKYEVFQPEKLDLTQEFTAFRNAGVVPVPQAPAPAPAPEICDSPPSLVTDREGSQDESDGSSETFTYSPSRSKPYELTPTREATNGPTCDQDVHCDSLIETTELGLAGPAIVDTEAPDFGLSPDFVGWNGSIFGEESDDLIFEDQFQQLVPAGEKDILTTDRKSRSLLQIFYGYQPEFTFDPGPGLETENDFLVRCYFEKVCPVYSAFDTDRNPFREQVQRAWTTLPAIAYAIQSMSAAVLADSDRDSWEEKGMALQELARKNLSSGVPFGRCSSASMRTKLMPFLLLGPSASWHRPGDIGREYLAQARKVLLPALMSRDAQPDDFIEGCIMYWEMLTTYVTEPDSDLIQQPPPASRYTNRGPDDRIRPHPWTGVAPHIVLLFAEIGRLIRHQLRFDEQLAKGVMDVDLSYLQQAMQAAQNLEDQLLSAEIPTEDDIEDIDDPNTSKRDLITLAEAYRYAGLLQLYRVFPVLLHQRLGGSRNFQNNCFDRTTGSISRSALSPDFDDAQNAQIWLSELAFVTVKSLSTISVHSGSICVQPILLVAVASELRRHASLDYFDVETAAKNLEIAKARKFCEERMLDFSKRLPSKPLQVMLKLTKEVWKQADRTFPTSEGVFWVNVMVKNGWETFMG